MDSKICFEMIFFVVEAKRERCASFMILTATVSEICGGQTNVSILVTSIDVGNKQSYIVMYSNVCHIDES